MATGFSVTFERYLPHDDDGDICEADEIGFVVENVTLRVAMRDGLEYSRPEWSGFCEPDCFPAHGVRWLVFTAWNNGSRENIQDGVHETRSLHFPDSLTESSRVRICRLFRAYGFKRESSR